MPHIQVHRRPFGQSAERQPANERKEQERRRGRGPPRSSSSHDRPRVGTAQRSAMSSRSCELFLSSGPQTLSIFLNILPHYFYALIHPGSATRCECEQALPTFRGLAQRRSVLTVCVSDMSRKRKSPRVPSTPRFLCSNATCPRPRIASSAAQRERSSPARIAGRGRPGVASLELFFLFGLSGDRVRGR